VLSLAGIDIGSRVRALAGSAYQQSILKEDNENVINGTALCHFICVQ
jgi:hypothetical protein